MCCFGVAENGSLLTDPREQTCYAYIHELRCASSAFCSVETLFGAPHKYPSQTSSSYRCFRMLGTVTSNNTEHQRVQENRRNTRLCVGELSRSSIL